MGEIITTQQKFEIPDFPNENRTNSYKAAMVYIPSSDYASESVRRAYATFLIDVCALDDSASEGKLSSASIEGLRTLTNLVRLNPNMPHLDNIVLDLGRHIILRALKDQKDPSGALVHGMVAASSGKTNFDIAQAVVSAGYFPK